MVSTIPKVFFAYPSRAPTLKEAIDVAVPELNEKGQVKIKTWEQCNIGGKLVIETICEAIDESQLFFADLTGLNANVMFELGYAIARGKRIWLILDDTYTEAKNMFEQVKILTTVGYVSCCNSQNIVSGFNKDKPFADIESKIFRAPIEPNLKPCDILYLKSRHENQAALHISNLLQERFPETTIVDAPNKPAVQSLADYRNLVFGCNGLVSHFTSPAREGAYLQTAQRALICGMAHGFNKPLLMLAEGNFSSPIDYRDFLKHYHAASEALEYLKEWLPRVEQDLKVDQEETAVPRKIFITYAHQDTESQKKLKTHLVSMEREGKIAVWDDNKIPISNEWLKYFSNNLTNSDILLYLVSPQSLASDNCNKELAVALHAKARIIPIILENCDWLNHQLSNFQALPDTAKPINKWQLESNGWQNVIDGIRKVVDKMQLQMDLPSRTAEKEQRGEYAEDYFSRGNTYHNKGNFDRAIDEYTKALELKLDYTEAYYNRGNAYHRKGNFDRAIDEYTKALELKLDYANAYNNRGNAYYNKGDYEKAIVDFNRAIELRPDDAKTYFGRGDAYADNDEFDNAIQDYNAALELNPDFGLVYYKRGVMWLRLRQWDDARADLTNARSMGADIITVFRHGYENVSDFEQKNGVKLPADLAEMLAPQQ